MQCVKSLNSILSNIFHIKLIFVCVLNVHAGFSPHLLTQGATPCLNLGPPCLNLSTLLKKLKKFLFITSFFLLEFGSYLKITT
jgi:hypothetical protein